MVKLTNDFIRNAVSLNPSSVRDYFAVYGKMIALVLGKKYVYEGFPGGSAVKNLPAMQEIRVQSLSQEDPLEKGMATHSSILDWRIPWTEEPGELRSIGLQRIGHD